MNVVSTIAICLLMMGMTNGDCQKGKNSRAGEGIWECMYSGNAASVPANTTEIFMELDGIKLDLVSMEHLTNLHSIALID